MKFTTKENQVFTGETKISNFSISKTGDNRYEINNGKTKSEFYFATPNLKKFKEKIYCLGNYLYTGNTNQLELLLSNLKISKTEEKTFLNKAIVFSGPIASGKTFISSAISCFFPERTIKIYRHQKNLIWSDILKDKKLVIIDECNGEGDILSLENVRENFPSVNFIFCTQSDVLDIDKEKYNLIRLP